MLTLLLEPLFFLLHLIKVILIYLMKKGFSKKNPHDIRILHKTLKPCQKGFQPLTYLCPSQGVFIGLGQSSQAVFWDLSFLQKNHMALIGESGCGKTSLATTILAQCAHDFNECVIVFDPKNDTHMLLTLAHHVGLDSFHYLNLSPDAPPQINPFEDASPSDIEMMFISGLQLFSSGHAGADYYRGEDREAARLSSALIAQKKLCFPEFLKYAGKINLICKRNAFWRECQQLGFLPALQAHSGLALASCLKPGHVLYISGDTAQPRTQSALRLIMERVVQLIGQRDRHLCPVVAFFIDEIRYVLSEVLLTALSTIRDKQVHLILAFQDIANLTESSGLSAQAAAAIVLTNASIKIIHRISHEPTIQAIEKIAGYHYVGNKPIPRIPHGMLSHLPKPLRADEAGVGLVLGEGPAYLIRSSPFLDTKKIKYSPSVYLSEACPHGIRSEHDLI